MFVANGWNSSDDNLENDSTLCFARRDLRAQIKTHPSARDLSAEDLRLRLNPTGLPSFLVIFLLKSISPDSLTSLQARQPRRNVWQSSRGRGGPLCGTAALLLVQGEASFKNHSLWATETVQ